MGGKKVVHVDGNQNWILSGKHLKMKKIKQWITSCIIKTHGCILTECRSISSNSFYSFMLITIGIILLILWLLGVVGVYTIGWYIHILLVVAVIVFLVRIIQGRNPLQ
jgi:hypothetical protein